MIQGIIMLGFFPLSSKYMNDLGLLLFSFVLQRRRKQSLRLHLCFVGRQCSTRSLQGPYLGRRELLPDTPCSGAAPAAIRLSARLGFKQAEPDSPSRKQSICLSTAAAEVGFSLTPPLLKMNPWTII